METGEIIFGVVNSLILVVTAYFIYRSLYSPVDSVKVGRQLSNEQQKDNAKRNLFLTLFALRGSPLSFDFVRGLNQIDIVFEDSQLVLDAWHTHYDSLQIKGQVNENQIWDLQRADLLSVMAVSLGYNRIRQTDMMKNYYPEGHNNQIKMEMDFREAEFLYHKSGALLHEKAMQQMDVNQQSPSEADK
jgi:hypothetical protein